MRNPFRKKGWSPGDLAIIGPYADRDPRLPARFKQIPIGALVQLIKYIGKTRHSVATDIDVLFTAAWEVDFEAGDKWLAEEYILQPVPPSEETTSWEECEFQPKELVVVEAPRVDIDIEVKCYES